MLQLGNKIYFVVSQLHYIFFKQWHSNSMMQYQRLSFATAMGFCNLQYLSDILEWTIDFHI